MMDINNGPCSQKSKKRKMCIENSQTFCKKDIQKGVICFLVEGALTVPFNRDKTLIQKFYFCPTACIFNSSSWTNIKRPTCFAVEDVDRSYGQTVAKRFGLVLTD